ncbi:Hint domain-containing protein [Defluviimonas sp. SAOS-178_SWC]|uniref:Hint domain-containing protein n=1 Tax=Defluviimonas sp. SAOS-178_SWC TaxID=3121287 RepID=UPI0032214C72
MGGSTGMVTGYRGTFVISAAQMELDGIRSAPVLAIEIGAQWRWWGDPVRVDGPAELLLLDGAEGAAELHRRAAPVARRLLGRGPSGADRTLSADDDMRVAQSFVVTDGHATYTITVLDPSAEPALLMVAGALPPRDTDLYVTGHSVDPPLGAGDDGGMICFTPGTRIATPDGPRLVEAIRPGDPILTRDDGAVEVLWTSARRMSGARLYAMPRLRPVRIRAGGIGDGRPEDDLIVSPDHRLLVTGARAQALFNETEVLAAARDLIDDRMVVTETHLREVTYIHLLTERHQIVWANGVETESFHPANADLDLIDPDQRAALLGVVPGLDADPFRYGAYARRNLTASEAAILRYVAA